MPDGPEAELTTCIRSFSLVLSATDQRGVVRQVTRSVAVAPTVAAGGPEPASPLVFRALGSVARRGGPLTFELPDAAAGGSLDVLDLAGRVLFRRPVARDDGATMTLALPRSLEAGLYFARLVSPRGTCVTRFVVVPR